MRCVLRVGGQWGAGAGPVCRVPGPLKLVLTASSLPLQSPQRWCHRPARKLRYFTNKLYTLKLGVLYIAHKVIQLFP